MLGTILWIIWLYLPLIPKLIFILFVLDGEGVSVSGDLNPLMPALVLEVAYLFINAPHFNFLVNDMDLPDAKLDLFMKSKYKWHEVQPQTLSEQQSTREIDISISDEKES